MHLLIYFQHLDLILITTTHISKLITIIKLKALKRKKLRMTVKYFVSTLNGFLKGKFKNWNLDVYLSWRKRQVHIAFDKTLFLISWKSIMKVRIILYFFQFSYIASTKNMNIWFIEKTQKVFRTQQLIIDEIVKSFVVNISYQKYQVNNIWMRVKNIHFTIKKKVFFQPKLSW